MYSDGFELVYLPYAEIVSDYISILYPFRCRIVVVTLLVIVTMRLLWTCVMGKGKIVNSSLKGIHTSMEYIHMLFNGI